MVDEARAPGQNNPFGLEFLFNQDPTMQDLSANFGNPQDMFGNFQSYLPSGEGQETVDQLGTDFDMFAASMQPQLEQQISDADIRAEATRSQLEQAGLLGLAGQFRRARSAANVDAARRGTLGGTYQLGQEEQARQGVERGAGEVALNAQQVAEQQRMAELAPVFGFQTQLAQGSPYQDLGQNLLLQNFQQLGQGAQGQFDINQTIGNIQSGTAMNQAANLNAALGGLSQGLQGGIQGYQNQQYMQNLNNVYNPAGIPQGSQYGFNTGPGLQNYNTPGGGIYQTNPNSGVGVGL